MSFVVALAVAVLLNCVDRLITRRSLRDHDLADNFLLVYQLTCTLITAPFALFFLIQSPLPTPDAGLGFAVVLGVATVLLWGVYSVASFRSARLLELSVSSTVGRLRIIITAIFGMIFFGEHLSPAAIVGVLILLVAFIPVSTLPTAQLNRRGLTYALVATLAISFALMADKALTEWFSPEVVVFIGFLGTTIIAFVLNRHTRLSHAKPVLVTAVIAGAAGAGGYFALVTALAAGPASIILPVYQASALLYVVAGIILLGERNGWGKKILSGCIAAVGTALVFL